MSARSPRKLATPRPKRGHPIVDSDEEAIEQTPVKRQRQKTVSASSSEKSPSKPASVASVDVKAMTIIRKGKKPAYTDDAPKDDKTADSTATPSGSGGRLYDEVHPDLGRIISVCDTVNNVFAPTRIPVDTYWTFHRAQYQYALMADNKPITVLVVGYVKDWFLRERALKHGITVACISDDHTIAINNLLRKHTAEGLYESKDEVRASRFPKAKELPFVDYFDATEKLRPSSVSTRIDDPEETIRAGDLVVLECGLSRYKPGADEIANAKKKVGSKGGASAAQQAGSAGSPSKVRDAVFVAKLVLRNAYLLQKNTGEQPAPIVNDEGVGAWNL